MTVGIQAQRTAIGLEIVAYQSGSSPLTRRPCQTYCSNDGLATFHFSKLRIRQHLEQDKRHAVRAVDQAPERISRIDEGAVENAGDQRM